MISKKIKVIDVQGLHLRPAAKIVTLAKNYQAEIFIKKADQKKLANSVLSILKLEIKVDDIITLIVDGKDELSALPAILQLLYNERFCIIV